MSDLSSKEKIILEKFLCMGGGYVLDFSNRTFEEFIRDNTGLEIYDDLYTNGSGSKGQRLRAFWEKENNYTIGNLIKSFIDYRRTRSLLDYQKIDQNEENIITECNKIADRLLSESAVTEISELSRVNPKDEFKVLTESIIDLIGKNQPEAALDRLHTYLMKYFRELCAKYKIETDKSTTLNALLGSYIKEIDSSSLIESEMTRRILKSSISILESFNTVRNDKSFAHDNKVLNYDESILIFNNIVSLIKFINKIESKISTKQSETLIDDIPF